MKTSIVILTYNKLEYTRLCIESVRKHTKSDSYEIIVIDNHSTDGTVDWLEKQEDITVIANEDNLGFPKGCNQGIEIATGDNILLLNNDTIVTHNWLTKLVSCLYRSEDIGAVGPVTNNCSYYQTIPIKYDSIDEMQKFAIEYNHSNSSLWEERTKLIGYCMLIKKSVVKQVGLLDEMFTPGNYEDDDYSLRIRQAGYKVMLCKDTFIHHFGSVSFRESTYSYSDLMNRNRLKFLEKWGFDPDTSNVIRHDIIQLITKPKDAAIRVLEIGCANGSTLLKVKNEYANALLYGIEANPSLCNVANLLAEVSNLTVDEFLNSYPELFFDVIIFNDNLQNFDEPLRVLNMSKKYLKEDGQLIASIPNLVHFNLLKSLLAGTIARAELQYLTPVEIIPLFENSGFKNISINTITLPKGSEDQIFLKELSEISSVKVSEYNEIFKFLVTASIVGSTKDIEDGILNEKIQHAAIKRENNLMEVQPNGVRDMLELLLEIDSEQNVLENAMELLHRIKDQDELQEELLETINNNTKHRVDVYNLLAVTAFENEIYDPIIPILQKSLECDPLHKDTLINLSVVLAEFGEVKLALEYLSNIKEKTEDVVMLIERLSGAGNDILNIEQNDVQFTGERLVINQEVKDKYSNVLEEHIHRYQMACHYADGKLVLDAACGAGYGSMMLQQAGAKYVIGVDISEDSLKNARKTYGSDNVIFDYGDVNQLSFDDSSFDVVVSFETIEHIENGASWIKESARLLKDEGLFLVSTPNRLITNPGTFFGEQPMNPHHRYEYSVTEFVGELLMEYEVLELYGQTLTNDHEGYYSKVMRQLRKLNTESIPNQSAQTSSHELIPLGEVKDAQPMYVVAVCRKKRK
jgi:GT2 family glycosyltransferase/cyclopropane fatty-acyl-phospholipid synthase-like methyltransferase